MWLCSVCETENASDADVCVACDCSRAESIIFASKVPRIHTEIPSSKTDFVPKRDFGTAPKPSGSGLLLSAAVLVISAAVWAAFPKNETTSTPPVPPKIDPLASPGIVLPPARNPEAIEAPIEPSVPEQVTAKGVICNQWSPITNLRRGPSAQLFDVEASLQNHLPVTVLGTADSPVDGTPWLRIQVDDADQHVGYVDAQFVHDDCELPQIVEDAAKHEVVTITTSYWNFNDSVMLIESVESDRKVYYFRPREGLAEVGVKLGTLLLAGTKSDKDFVGTAHTFSKNCGARPYTVTGKFNEDENVITLNGSAPIVNKNCEIVKYTDRLLTFYFLR
jgi:hypothetical protein